MSWIDDDDKKLMSKLASGETTPDRVGEDIDPLDKPPVYESEYSKKLPIETSMEMVKYAEENSLKEAAERYGVSVNTVQKHRATFNPEYSYSDTIKFQDTKVVSKELCAVMRFMLQDGMTLDEIADRFDVSQSTVYLHASASDGRNCSHDLDIERVEL